MIARRYIGKSHGSFDLFFYFVLVIAFDFLSHFFNVVERNTRTTKKLERKSFFSFAVFFVTFYKCAIIKVLVSFGMCNMY